MAIRDKEFYKRSNKILEKLAWISLTEYQHKYCLILYRKTFGFGKYEDIISRSQFEELTGMDPTNVSHVRNQLKKRNIFHKKGNIEGFNLNTNQWDKVFVQTLLKIVSPQTLNSVSQADKNSVSTNTYKETTKKLTKEGVILNRKMTRKEILELEGKPWLEADMVYNKGYSKDFVNRYISMAPFMTLYNAYVDLDNAWGVKDRCAWLMAKVDREPREED